MLNCFDTFSNFTHVGVVLFVYKAAVTSCISLIQMFYTFKISTTVPCYHFGEYLDPQPLFLLCNDKAIKSLLYVSQVPPVSLSTARIKIFCCIPTSKCENRRHMVNYQFNLAAICLVY